jgi:uncharacterized protein YabN with tetrapyrrole methylase and pyrophosphatase domain
MTELIIVGTGISVSHLTIEAINEIQSADKVLYLVPDPITEQKICDLNKTSESLIRFYVIGKERTEIYKAMVEYILSLLPSNSSEFTLCVAFYGHPGIFTFPSHLAIERARTMDIDAKMLPGISAEDCLFADLGIDPGTNGCQTYEATYFLEKNPRINTNSLLLLWQIGITGNYDYQIQPKKESIRSLKKNLLKVYSEDHPIIFYEATTHKLFKSKIIRSKISDLDDVEISSLMTLCILPE